MRTFNDNTVDSFLDNNDKCIIMFGASWCGPCKVAKPRFEGLEKDYPNIAFAYCDVDESQKTAQSLGVMSVPTFITFFDGSDVQSTIGANGDGMKNILDKLASMG